MPEIPRAKVCVDCGEEKPFFEYSLDEGKRAGWVPGFPPLAEQERRAEGGARRNSLPMNRIRLRVVVSHSFAKSTRMNGTRCICGSFRA